MQEQTMDSVQVVTGLEVPLADGTLLSGDLRRPAGAAAGPVLVSYYPYRKDDIIGSLFEGTRIALCGRGYGSLFVDMAGTGASEGTGESFDLPREGRDLAEIIEWAARQDWCDGSVGAWGVSYGGMTALAAAAHRPPHLRAIMAAYASTDPYRDTIAPGGCPGMLGRYAWAAHMVALALCPPTLQDRAGRWRDTWHRRLSRLAGGQPHAVMWQAHPERDEYWESRVVDATAIDVPAMFIGGWADAYSDSIIRAFGEVRGPRRLVLGPWMHVLPHLSDVEPYDWVGAMADWWDAHLRPSPPAPAPAAVASAQDDPPVVDPPVVDPPVLFFAGGGGGWRSARQWPPEGGKQLRLFLTGHSLAAAAPAEPGSRAYQGDPAVGVAAGIWDPFGTGHGWPQEQSGDDAASLAFTSEPLPEPVLIAGSPEAQLYVGLPAGHEAHLVARLSMVGADGRSTLITAGWLRVPPAGGPVAGGPVAGEQAGGDGGAASLTATAITLGSVAFAVPAGARLRLSIACADFPHLWPSPENPALVVGFGAGRASLLRLPVSGTAGHDPAVVPAPPPGRDAGWVTDGQPVYRVSQDKVAGEVAVTFGATARLAPPSGAELNLAETFTARLQASRPDGAAMLAQVDVSLRLPAGERVEVRVRAVAQRQSSVTEASVVVDGAELLHQRWAGTGPAPEHS
ncbi:MAG TPA: CocE/NonD family hydrolase [Streptosporangiaceae bacterium]|nr:CocE/NonD family hydrolase [Streptosporangiaceae bacterium]